MKEHPILFSGPMVRALLAGTKTQTRRVVKPQPDHPHFKGMLALDDEGIELFLHDRTLARAVRCPYGKPGDRLWVKETWRTAKSLDAKSPATIGEMCIDAGYRTPWAPLAYEADGHRNSEWRGFEMSCDAEPGKTRVSIHMPHWASRITLEITAVRVERLQDISEADAIAEGLERGENFPGWYRGPLPGDSPELQRIGADHKIPTAFPRLAYQALWEQINGHGSWDANPWVWVVEFRKC